MKVEITPHIVELEPGVWMAPIEGDPGRTLVKENARIFKSENFALLGLKLARKYRPFVNACVERVEALDEQGQ